MWCTPIVKVSTLSSSTPSQWCHTATWLMPRPCKSQQHVALFFNYFEHICECVVYYQYHRCPKTPFLTLGCPIQSHVMFSTQIMIQRKFMHTMPGPFFVVLALCGIIFHQFCMKNSLLCMQLQVVSSTIWPTFGCAKLKVSALGPCFISGSFAVFAFQLLILVGSISVKWTHKKLCSSSPSWVGALAVAIK